jgi:hypothetical protein
MPEVERYTVKTEGVGRVDYSLMVEHSTEPTVRSYQSNYNHSEVISVPANYSIGTATFTVGSTHVVGTGTVWTAAMVGRRIRNNTGYYDLWFDIQSVEDATHLTLSEPYYYLWSATVGVPVAYTIGGKVVNIAVPTDQVVMAYDFVASRPNNKLIQLQVESVDLRGAVASVADQSAYQTVEAHLAKGYGFINIIRFIVFNFDDAAEPFVRITCNGFYSSAEEFYLSVAPFGAP